jgi:galactitol PTS system EIIA component
MPKNEVMLEGLAIEERNILVKAHAASAGDIIRQLGGLLHENGFVKDTFVQAVLEREVIYPTGLQTSLLGFAIPHTDTQHVLLPAVAVATLDQPAVFRAMDDPSVEIPVSIVMMLAISNPDSVVHVLRKVISILEDEPALLKIVHAATTTEIRQAVCEHIRSIVDTISTGTPPEFNHS